jgi:hypothetical protein
MKLSKIFRWGASSLVLMLSSSLFAQTTSPKILGFTSGQNVRHNGLGVGDTFNIHFNGGGLATTQHINALNPPAGTNCMSGFKYGVILSPNTFEKEMFVSKGYFPDYVQLSWEVVRFQSQITGFKIFRRELDSGQPFVQVANIANSSTSWKDEFSEAGVLYEYKLKAEGIFPIEVPFLNLLSGVGFRLPSGKVSGRVTYKGGGAVQGVTVIPETNDNFSGRSLLLNGTSSYLAISPKANDTKFSFASNFTFQAWVKPTSTGLSTIFEKGSQYKITHQNGQINFTANGVITTLNFTQKADTFFNVTVQRTADSLKIYVLYDNEVYYKTSVAFSGTTPANTNEILIGKNATNTEYFGGYFDEVRIWSRALPESEILRESFRLIAGTEDGLSGYYRMNEGVGSNFYDLSRKGFTFNENHGFMTSSTTWSNVVPLRAQLSVKGYTDANGNYLITGIPYTSDGSTYRIVPAFGVHSFDPTERLLFVGPGSNVYSDVNFEDVASFTVAGFVYYKNTAFPVEGVSVKVDGQLLLNSDGFPITSKNDGSFAIDVPIGKHQLQFVKNGHVFRNNGYWPSETSKFDFQQNYTIQQDIIDSTLIKVVGKVVGGPVEGSKVNGLGKSVNNIGNAKITMTTQKEFDLKPKNTGISAGVWDNKYYKNDSVLTKYGTTKYTINNPKIIELEPDPVTGEFYTYLLPERYVVTNVIAGNLGNSSPDYTFSDDFGVLDFAQFKPSILSTDSVQIPGTQVVKNGDTTWSYRVDSVRFDYEQNFVLRVNPLVSVTSANPTKERFWDDKLTINNVEVPIVNDDSYGGWKFDAPIFTQYNTYKAKVKVFEQYTNNDNGGQIDKVPVIDGVVAIQNDFAINGFTQRFELDKFGEYTYEFVAGFPKLEFDTVPLKQNLTLRVFTGKNGSIVSKWPVNKDYFEAYVVGNLPKKGSNFVTKGPNVPTMVIRDPYGSNSYSYLEKNTTTTSENSWSVNKGNTLESKFGVMLGVEIETTVGLGFAIRNKIETENTFGVSMKQSTQHIDEGTSYVSTTNTEIWQTSAEPDFVGAQGDIFIGNSTNLAYGESSTIGLQQTNSCANTSLPCIAGYKIGATTSFRISPEFSTAFQYSQYHIENNLIPQLERLRDVYLDKMLQTNSGYGNMVYVLNISSRKGQSNTFNLETYRADNSGINGDVYSINFPSSFRTDPNPLKVYTDTVALYNSQIKNWKQILANNEQKKVEARNPKNYSYDAGVVFESSRSVSRGNASTYTYEFSVAPGAFLDAGFAINGLGVKTEIALEYNHTESETETTSNDTTTTFGFVLNDGDQGDFYSIDVADPKDGTGPVFKVKGGQSMCPYVDAEKTKYFAPLNQTYSEATMQREIPEISSFPSIITDVPQGRSANFGLKLRNISATGDDAWYRLSIDESSIVGGTLKIDGADIANGRTFFIPAGGTLEKSLNLTQAVPDSFKFENVKLVLHSLCEQESIADTVEISAYFQPACSPITITNPNDLWLINTNKINYSGTEIASIPLNIGLRNYDLNHTTFEKMAVQYKSSSSSLWITDMMYYKDFNDFNAASAPKTHINGQSQIDYVLEMKSLQDRNYDVRLQTFCADGTKNESDIVSGIKDVKRPKLFGSPQPGDGILSPGDDVMVTFDEDIQQGLLTSMNFTVKGVLNGADIAHNSVLYFDGIDDYASVVEGVKLTDKSFSVEFWTKRLRDGVNEVMYSQGDVEIGFNAANNVYAKFGSQTITSSVSFPKNDVWEHYAMAYDFKTEKVSIYKDDDIVIDNLDVTPTFSIAGRMNIGASINNSNFYKGYIHDYRVWESARGYGSVVANMNVSQTGDKVGLSGFWPMDEADGLVAKDLSRNHHAILNGATWAVFPVGYAANFDGSNSLTMPAGELIVTDDMDMTIEFWMKASAQSNTVMFSNGKGDGTDASPPFKNIWVLGANASGKLYAKNNGVELVATKDVFDNNWHHVAVVLKRIGNTALYIDGSQEVFNQSINFGGLSGAQIALGARQTYSAGPVYSYDRNYTGKLDEVRVWKLARTKTLIDLDKNAKLKGDEVGLMAYYPFDAYDVNLVLQSSLKDQVENSTKTLANNGATLSNADVPNIKDARPVQNVRFNWVVNDDKLIINVTEDAELTEKTVLEFTVLDIEDLNENRLASPITWTAYIRKNTVLWDQTVLNFEKELYEKVAFDVDIINKGGTEQNYNISNLPSWLSVDEPSGTLAPDSKKTLKFEISEGANIGKYEQSIYLGSDFGFLEKLEINLTVKGQEPDWTVNATSFDNNMSVIGLLRIDGIISTNPDDKIAAFVGDEIRGVANLQYVAAYDQYEFFLDIYSDLADGENIEFKVWNASEGKIQINVTPEITFAKNGIIGTPSSPQIFDANDNVSVGYPLKKGWNWVSFNVNSTDFNNTNKLLAELDALNGDVVKTLGKFDQYSSSMGWLGQISLQGGFDLEHAYKIKVAKADTFTVVGSIVETQSVDIQLNPGWNWVGYPSQLQMSLNDALANVNFQNGDFIKGQNGFAIYDQFLGWVGSLKYMQPIKGYMLKVAGSHILNYPNPELLAGARQARLATVFHHPDCVIIPENYEKDMSFVIQLDLCNSNIDPLSDVLMVKVNGECRGVIEPYYVSTSNKYFFFLSAFANVSGEKLEFSFLDASENKTYAITETYNFAADAIVGDMQNPHKLTITDRTVCKILNTDEQLSDLIQVFPNPFDDKVYLTLNKDLPDATLFVTDLNGKIIANLQNDKTIVWDGLTVDGHQLATGVYLLNVETPESTYRVKLVKE